MKLGTDNLMSGTWLQILGNNGDPDYTVLLLSPGMLNLNGARSGMAELTVWCPMSSRTFNIRMSYVVKILGRVSPPFPDRSVHLRTNRK